MFPVHAVGAPLGAPADTDMVMDDGGDHDDHGHETDDHSDHGDHDHGDGDTMAADQGDHDQGGHAHAADSGTHHSCTYASSYAHSLPRSLPQSVPNQAGMDGTVVLARGLSTRS